MFVIIGVVIVFGSIIAGYLLEKGNLMVLVQPAELLIVGGAAVGTVLVANPLHILKAIVNGAIGAFKGSKFDEAHYLETLKMMYHLFTYGRRSGLPKLETDVEEPQKSQIFTKYPRFLADHHALAFVCDTLRVAVSAGATPFDLDQMMELDLDLHHHESGRPSSALTTMADSLPGLGIVAAVLGVVITMGALGGPPEEIGPKVAAALVGTFLGILLCYGFFAPLAQNMAKQAEDEGQYYNCLRVGLIAFLKGASPLIAVEFARRVIPGHVRPGFLVMEATCKGKPVPAAQAASAAKAAKAAPAAPAAKAAKAAPAA
jgi:chemotaxis protein MotA